MDSLQSLCSLFAASLQPLCSLCASFSTQLSVLPSAYESVCVCQHLKYGRTWSVWKLHALTISHCLLWDFFSIKGFHIIDKPRNPKRRAGCVCGTCSQGSVEEIASSSGSPSSQAFASPLTPCSACHACYACAGTCSKPNSTSVKSSRLKSNAR